MIQQNAAGSQASKPPPVCQLFPQPYAREWCTFFFKEKQTNDHLVFKIEFILRWCHSRFIPTRQKVPLVAPGGLKLKPLERVCVLVVLL